MLKKLIAASIVVTFASLPALAQTPAANPPAAADQAAPPAQPEKPAHKMIKHKKHAAKKAKATTETGAPATEKTDGGTAQ